MKELYNLFIVLFSISVTMKCILQGLNARVFAKAIQSLSKFGSDLFLEAEINGLALRTINSTKSAFGSFTFFPNFFYEFEVDPNGENNNSCKLSMKACLGVFKNMRQVEFCIIQIDSTKSKLNVKLKCRFETIKNHLISIVDVEIMAPSFCSEDVQNSITGTNKIFGEMVNNFQMAEEEITLEVKTNLLFIKNYVEGSRVDNKFMRSQLILSHKEFEQYEIGNETSITFCLREFRAFLLFAESVNMPLIIKFQDCGQPIACVIKNTTMFEGTLVMSTLSNEDISYYNEKNTNLQPSPICLQKRSRQEENISGRKKLKATENLSMDKKTANDTQSQSLNLVRGHPEFTKIKDINPVVTTRLQCNVNTDTEYTLTFKNTEDIEVGECVPQSPPREEKPIRTIFSRCFERTYVPREPSPTSEVFIPNSDDE